jgi:hypothetical protein
MPQWSAYNAPVVLVQCPSGLISTVVPLGGTVGFALLWYFATALYQITFRGSRPASDPGLLQRFVILGTHTCVAWRGTASTGAWTSAKGLAACELMSCCRCLPGLSGVSAFLRDTLPIISTTRFA